ncbi:fucolectin-5-like [Argopecten irradians]|uniref:fucolectin-5-like n=1 Tax=Argopecten irradians TaxID=31199 RepID=UPI0037248E8F
MSDSSMRIINPESWLLCLLMCHCAGTVSDIRDRHFRIDERYADRVPLTGILWTKTNLIVRWCLYECHKDADCSTVFYGNGVCYGYFEKLHDMIATTYITGVIYYEMAGPVGNLAVGKSYLQSSEYNSDGVYGPEKAADSKRYPFQNEVDWSKVSCAHTAYLGEEDEDHSPFWQVDLGSRHLVLSVSFLGRIECCGERNQRLNITVAETASGPRALCLYYAGPPFVGEMKTFFCDKPLNGQFVRISRDEIVLNPCEIEVYGYPLGP